MAESRHCGNSNPHRSHDYTGTGVKDGKIAVITYSCPGTSDPNYDKPKKERKR